MRRTLKRQDLGYGNSMKQWFGISNSAENAKANNQPGGMAMQYQAARGAAKTQRQRAAACLPEQQLSPCNEKFLTASQ